jgi:hypothetical protein
MGTSEMRQMLEYAINVGRGGIYLKVDTGAVREADRWLEVPPSWREMVARLIVRDHSGCAARNLLYSVSSPVTRDSTSKSCP